MPNPALPAINTLLKVATSLSPLTYGDSIANIGDLSGPSISATIVDVTSHSTGTPWREKIPTLLDGGVIAVPVYWIPSDAGHKALLQLFSDRGFGGEAGQPIPFLLVFPDEDATEYPFEGFVTKFNLKEAVAGVVTADVEFTVSGEITFPS